MKAMYLATVSAKRINYIGKYNKNALKTDRTPPAWWVEPVTLTALVSLVQAPGYRSGTSEWHWQCYQITELSAKSNTHRRPWQLPPQRKGCDSGPCIVGMWRVLHRLTWFSPTGAVWGGDGRIGWGGWLLEVGGLATGLWRLQPGLLSTLNSMFPDAPRCGQASLCSHHHGQQPILTACLPCLNVHTRGTQRVSFSDEGEQPRVTHSIHKH